ncbi:MAG TPA: hypothetical protein VLC91_08845 [Spongiibacteraceae bacterium]|nr:hypothetical protein [Spongiibacteraceae bacterium]
MTINKYQIKNWLDLNIGELSDDSQTHGKAVMFISVLMMFVEPTVKVTLGQASLAGLGISVSPPITIPVGILLLALLTYRYISFWITTILDNGTNHKKSERKAAYKHNPYYGDEHPPQNMEQLVNEKAYEITFKWRIRKIIWAFFLPNIFALIALLRYGFTYF